MSSQPLDTRVTNGRFAGPGAPADGIVTIHEGTIVEAPERDVWRTVNASGHLVFPGLIQPGGTTVDTALGIVRGGTTTAIARCSDGRDTCLDVLAMVAEDLQVIEPDASGELTSDDWNLLLSDEPVHFQAPAGSNFPVIHFLFHEGHLKREMTLERIAAVTSGSIASATGNFPRKASFSPGADGDLFVFDPDADDPYSDIPWPGRVIFSLVRGSILLYNGQIHTSDGSGKLLS